MFQTHNKRQQPGKHSGVRINYLLDIVKQQIVNGNSENHQNRESANRSIDLFAQQRLDSLCDVSNKKM